MLRRVESVIFDLDGTLWNTADICADAWSQALIELGLPDRKITQQDIEGIMGLTKDEIRKKLFGDLSEDLGMSVLGKCFEKEVQGLSKSRAPLYPFVEEGIPRLAQHYTLFLVSNCGSSYLDVFLEISGLKKYFRAWECHGNTKLSKAENISLIISRYSLSSCVYVGDTVTDCVSSRAAGVPFVFVDYGFGKCPEYDFVFPDFRSLVEAFVRLGP